MANVGRGGIEQDGYAPGGERIAAANLCEDQRAVGGCDGHAPQGRQAEAAGLTAGGIEKPDVVAVLDEKGPGEGSRDRRMALGERSDVAGIQMEHVEVWGETTVLGVADTIAAAATDDILGDIVEGFIVERGKQDGTEVGQSAQVAGGGARGPRDF